MLKKAIKLILLSVLSLKFILYAKYYHFKKLKIAFVCSTPTHSNLGDHAIAFAEMRFIKYRTKNYKTIEVPFLCCNNFIKYKKTLIDSEDIVLIIGGGNMGDLYLSEEICRRNLVDNFLYNHIIIFPQTIYFQSQMELAKTIKCYSGHKNLTIIARENKSYFFMKSSFTKNKVILTPDIVLSISLNKKNKKQNRDGVLVCLRDDMEKSLSTKDSNLIKNFINNYFKTIKLTDTISKKRLILPFMRVRELDKKFMEFSSSKLVVTDRLHGMIFSIITNTPCIVFSNNNHKISGTYNWVHGLSYIKFCKDIDMLESLYNEINIDGLFAYNPDMFKKYWDIIKFEINGDE